MYEAMKNRVNDAISDYENVDLAVKFALIVSFILLGGLILIFWAGYDPRAWYA